MNPKYYIVLSNGCIGYVSTICTCSECKQRGETEWLIHSLNDEYLDSIKHRDLLNDVLNIALSIKDLSHERGNEYKLKMIAEVYMSELLKHDTAYKGGDENCKGLTSHAKKSFLSNISQDKM